MLNFIKYDDGTGEIFAVGQVTRIASAVLQEGAGAVVTMLDDGAPLPDPAAEFLDLATGAFAPRPTVAAPAGAEYDLPALPAGTVVRVWNEADDMLEITDLSEALSLTDAGGYRFEVRPPFPFVPVFAAVEVL